MVVSNQHLGRGTASQKSAEPIVGYKCTTLRLVRAGNGERIILFPTYSPHKINVDLHAVSKCKMFKWHTGKPGRFCDCGFYAYKEVINAIKHTFRNNMVIVKTVMSGKVLFYDKGLRAGIQRVTDMFIQLCDRPTCTLYADRVALFVSDDQDLEVGGICAYHAKGLDCRTFSWLEEKVNASLTKGEPDIKVRSIKKHLVLWDGSPEVKTTSCIS